MDAWEEMAGLHLLIGNPFMKHRAPEEPSIIMLGVLVLDQLVTKVALNGLVSLSGATLDIESHRACGEEAHENLAKVPLWLCKDIGLLPSLLPASVLDDHRNPQVRSFSRHEFVQE